MTLEERREAAQRRNELTQPLFQAIRAGIAGITTEHADRVALDAYDRLLAYFDEHEPAVADAIRYGGRTLRNSYGSVMLVIDKPDSEPSPMRMVHQPDPHVIGSDGIPRPVMRP